MFNYMKVKLLTALFAFQVLEMFGFIFIIPEIPSWECAIKWLTFGCLLNIILIGRKLITIKS